MEFRTVPEQLGWLVAFPGCVGVTDCALATHNLISAPAFSSLRLTKGDAVIVA